MKFTNKKNSYIDFNNQIELIHQEIQDILAVLEPHDKNQLAESVSQKLTSGPNPVIPPSLNPPKVHLKASAMHGLSSLLSSVEAHKKETQNTTHLNVAVLKGSYYYQSDETLKLAKTHQLTVLDGDRLAKSDLTDALESRPAQPIDLFVTEFHHNIQLTRQTYKTEDVLRQVKAMYANNMFAKQFTVLIDTTIDLEQSDDVRNFFDDSLIKGLITTGRLNVVLLRSAQKFDMLGMDNYYGGITATINKDTAFGAFDKRMSTLEDQLAGLSYQGLAHLQKFAGPYLDMFRKEIMENTQRLYRKLPKIAVFEPGSTNPMQISKIEDNRIFFLDVKFPNFPKAAKAFRSRFTDFTREKQLPFATRASFGFANTTVTIIDGVKFRLNPGLDSETILNQYALFFQAVQNTIESIKKDSNMTHEEHDSLVADSIAKIFLPQRH